MKLLLLGITFLVYLPLQAQKETVLEWINSNAIKIEDANPDTKLSLFNDNIPKTFQDAKIFGFGESTHHTKDFFDLKAKFFKYLVTTQAVKVFIIEDSYPAEAGINEWISGGKGNAETIANHFNLTPWYCKEVVQLLAWMRHYNLDKPKEEQIRVYGMDIQNVQHINHEIRDLVTKYNIPVSEELLIAVDQCVEKKVDYMKSTDWATVQIPKLKAIERLLLDFQKGVTNEVVPDFNSAVRALQYLIKYTYYVQHNYSQDRDMKMFENVTWIIENKSKNGKAFIWAHNEHINNKGFGNYSSRSIYNLGRYLKEKYKNEYYSVGFDFGKGTLGGYVFTPNQPARWNTYEVTEPFPETYAATLMEAQDSIYFIDMYAALHGNCSDFFKKNKKQLILGGSGYNPKQNNLYTKRFSEMYDGLIFVKNITVPNYKLGAE